MVSLLRNRVALLMAAFLSFSGNAAGQSSSFEMMEPPIACQTADFSLSQDGKSMACLLDGSVYWWTRALGFRFLDPGVPTASGVGIAADGSSIIAARAAESGARPTIWLRDGSIIDLGCLEADCHLDPSDNCGFDLSGDGSVAVGQIASCTGDIAFVWKTGQGLNPLPSPTGAESRTSATSAAGDLLVGFCERPEDGYRHPALWRDGEGPILFLGTGTQGEALNISPNGRYVVGQAALDRPGLRGFFWMEGSPAVILGNLSGEATDSSLAKAVADDGTVVGWSGDFMWGDQEAFIWTRRDGMVSLADYLTAREVELPEGMVLTAALDISADGSTIVGLCRDREWSPGFWRVQLGGSPMASTDVHPNPWEPLPMDSARPDSLIILPGDLLNPFPFGKRRF